MIIRSVSDLKEHLGRAINKATTDEFLMPYVRLAADEFIIPAIGPELYDELSAQLNGDPSALTEPNKKLLPMVQRALAFYAYWKYLPYAIGNDGENGLQESTTDKSTPVRLGMLEKRIRGSLHNGSQALERMLVYLDNFKSLYPTWTASPAYQESKALFIYSARELTEYLPQAAGSYRLYLSLRGYMKLVERDEIRPLISPALFDSLKMALKGPVINGDQKMLLGYIQDALAACAYRDALFNLNIVQTSGSGLRILSTFDGINNEKFPDSGLLTEAQRRAQAAAGSKLASLKRYLETNANLYPEYLNSSQYGVASPNAAPDNSQYNAIFRLR